ncbi:phage capsid protein, partial [Streptomyces sp. A73]|nr:phage capsid protein [Streptomyces sp. A73]
GRVLALERDEDGQVPTVGQFTAHDPQTYTKISDLYARIMATQLGLPPHYLGYTTDNPASADAIRSSEAQLVKRA